MEHFVESEFSGETEMLEENPPHCDSVYQMDWLGIKMLLIC
jgi:hypothetical protein